MQCKAAYGNAFGCWFQHCDWLLGIGHGIKTKAENASRLMGSKMTAIGWKTEPRTLMIWVPSLDNDGDYCKSLSMILIPSMMWVHFFCYKFIHRVASCLLVKIESLWWRSGLLQCRGEQRQPASCDTIAWRLGDPLANPRWFMRLSFSDYLGWILWSLENQIVQLPHVTP